MNRRGSTGQFERPRTVARSRSSNSFNANEPLRIEPFKFLAVISQQITLRQNYTFIETREPTSNYVYFARSLMFGKSFCVSVAKVLSEESPDFSFIIGFTTCLSSKILAENARHTTEQCTPAGCGGRSQQLKVFKANALRSRIRFERQPNGDIYFAINNGMPIHVNFDRSSCDINLTRHSQLTPYIELSGNVLALRIDDHCPSLNIQSAIAVRRGHTLATAPAYGPRISRELPIASEFKAHHALVSSSPDADTNFIKLRYPETDIKLSVNRMAVLRKNEIGEQFVFYVNKLLHFETQITFQVTKVYEAKKYTGGFVFGVTTASLQTIAENQRKFVTNSKVSPHRSYSVIINHNVKLNDVFTFSTSFAGQINITKNGEIQRDAKLILKGFQQTQDVVPFVILNGTVSGIMIRSSASGGTNVEFSRIHALPEIDFKTTENISVTDQTLIRLLSNNGEAGVVVNAKPFDKVLKFIIRDVRTSTTRMSLTFGLIDSAKVGFKTPHEIPTCLEVCQDNLIHMPAVGLKFSLYKTLYGKVTLKYEDGEYPSLTLFKVESSKCYYPVLILNGSVTAMELLPNPTNKIVKHIPTERKIERTSTQPLPPTNDCKICMDSTINSAFVPCGHRFACHACAEKWRENGNPLFGSNLLCPICRQPIRKILKTFD